MIWKFAYLPGIVVIGAVSYLLDLGFWQSVGISAIVYVLIMTTDALIERRKRLADRETPPSDDGRGRPGSGNANVRPPERSEQTGPPRFPDPGP